MGDPMMRMGGKMAGVASTQSAIGQIPGLLQQAGEAAMREGLEHLSQVIRDDYLQGPYPEEIERRSGRFRATFRRGDRDNIFQVTSEGTKILGTFGSRDVRAPILDQGGVIRPTRSQFLAVRTDVTKDSRGVVKAKYRGPLRALPNTFVRPIRAPKAKAAVFERIGTMVHAIAWLVKEVFIPGRQYAQKGVTKATPGIVQRFQVRFDAVLNRANEMLRKLGR
jgi:hypothetical protein